MNKQIISQLLIKFLEDFVDGLAPEKLTNLGSAVENLQQLSNECIVKAISTMINLMDQEIKNSVVRKSENLKVKESNIERTVVTAAGNLSYKRTYYQTASNDFIYLIDHLINVESYERIDKSLIADLVNLSLDMSFQKVLDTKKVELSRQTLNNKFLAIDELASDVEEENIQSLRNCLRYNNQDGFESVLKTVRERITDKKELQKFYDIRKYFRNNWESINVRLTRGVCGSCTEPMVSHLFASRISRTSCAWTSHGLSNMTMLRSYVANGDKVESTDIKVTRDLKREEDRRRKLKSIGIEKYNDYLKASMEKNQKEIRDIFYNEMIDYVIDVTGGVQKLIKIISQQAKIA